MAEKKSPRITNKKHVARQERENKQRRVLITISVIIVAAVLLTLAIGLLYDNVLKYNQPVANINGENITVRDFQDTVRYNRFQAVQQYLQYYQFYEAYPDFGAQLQPQLQQIQLQLSDTYADTIGTSVLDRLVDDAIVRQEAEKLGISVSEQEIDARFEQYFGYNQENVATPTAFPTQAPASTLSPEQLAVITLTPTATATEPPAEPTATPNSLARVDTALASASLAVWFTTPRGLAIVAVSSLTANPILFSPGSTARILPFISAQPLPAVE